MVFCSPPTAPPIGSPRVAECWADLTRALMLYPDTNSQVLRPLASLVGALRDGIDATSGAVELRFSARAVTIGDESFDLKEGSTVAWLKERLDRSDLSGVTFSESADEAALLAFTKRLLDLYRRRNMELGFAELWPRPYPGIALIERRFDGGFSGRARTRHSGPAARAAPGSR